MMCVAVTRKTRSGKYVLGHDEAITVDDAIKAVTINAAWQIFEEDTRGSLEVGKLADFTVLSLETLKIYLQKSGKVLKSWAPIWLENQPLIKDGRGGKSI